MCSLYTVLVKFNPFLSCIPENLSRNISFFLCCQNSNFVFKVCGGNARAFKLSFRQKHLECDKPHQQGLCVWPSPTPSGLAEQQQLCSLCQLRRCLCPSVLVPCSLKALEEGPVLAWSSLGILFITA